MVLEQVSISGSKYLMEKKKKNLNPYLILYTKPSKWFRDLYVKSKFRRKHRGKKNLYNFGVGKDFLTNMESFVNHKKKFNKYHFMKFKT